MVILLFGINLWSQQTPYVQPAATNSGLPEGASFEGFNETINLNNGGVLVTLPLLSLPGLGGFDFKLNLRIDSKVYGMWGEQPPKYEPSSGTTTYTPPGFGISPNQGGISFAGGRLSTPALIWESHDYQYYEDDPLHTGSGSYQTISCVDSFIFTDMNGTMHGFSNRLPCQPYNIPTTPTINVTDAHDGSLLRLDTTNIHDMILRDQSGVQYHFDKDPGTPIRITDLNGNAITITGAGPYPANTQTITDSLNRTITITPTTISYQDSDGQTRQITASSSTDADADSPIIMLFDLWKSTDGQQYQGNDTPTNFGYHQSHTTLSMPTGEIYTFYYDALQELTKIQYPSGGYTRYVYHNVPGLYADSLFLMFGDVREIQKRAICARTDGNCSSSEEAVTNYEAHIQRPDGGYSGSNLTMDVRDPYSNRTHYEFSMSDPTTAKASHEINRYIYSGESTLLRTIHTDYGEGVDSYGYVIAEACSQPMTVTTTYNDANPTIQSHIEYEYDSYHPIIMSYGDGLCGPSISSNVTKKREYDFDGSLVRTTSTTWLSSSPDGLHILDRMTGQSITDASGFVSTKGWGYDSAGNLTSQTYGGTAMEDATTVFGRDSYGRLTSSTDPLNNVTTYTYDSPWADSACAPASTAPPSPSPSSVKDALNHVTSTLYNSCTGTVHSTTDANSQTTTFAYDAMARQTHVTYPTGGGELTTSYDPQPGNTITKIRTLDANRSATTKEIHDGVGRVVTQQNLAPTEGTTTIETTYDNRGLTSSVSNPFLTHDDPTYGVTSYAYDALGRVRYVCNPDNGTASCSPGASYRENAYSGAYVDSYDELRNHTKKLADALGRGIRVWEPDETNSPTIETQYTYNGLDLLTSVNQLGRSTAVTQGSSSDAARTRAFGYGGRGQLIQSSNPETGTICYGSLNSGTCVGGYDANNRLVTKTDARGVVTTFAYDVINRLTGKTYSGAVDPGQSPLATCYAYDQDANSGTNTVDRLVSEWTQPNGCDTALSSSAVSWKTGISYDSMGRLVAESQCPVAPCSTSNPMAYTYDYASSMTSSNNGLPSSASPGIGAIYDYDNASRLERVSTTWDAANHPPILFYAYGSMNVNQVNTQAYGPFGLLAAQYGLDYKSTNPSLADLRSYDIRGRLIDKLVLGQIALTTTTTTVTVSPTPVIVGGSATVTIHVSCNFACGQVDVNVNGTNLGLQTLDASGSVSIPSSAFPASALAVGNYTVTAQYQGDGTYAPSTGSATYSVTTQQTTTTVSFSPSEFATTEIPQVLAHVSCNSACGQVALLLDGNPWVPPYDLAGDGNMPGWWGINTWGTPSLGWHTVTASYLGNGTFAPSSGTTQIKVDPVGSQQTSMTLTLSSQNFTTVEDMVASVHVGCNTNCGAVQFYVDGSLWVVWNLDSNGNTSADTYWWMNPTLFSQGDHTLTATYTGNLTYAAVSQSQPFTVSPVGSQQTTISLSMNPSTTLAAADDYDIEVHVGCNSNCGLVQLLLDGNPWLIGSLNSYGQVGFQRQWIGPMPQGTHALTATYFGNVTYASQSTSTTVTINP